MSRIGKKLIDIPTGVEVKIEKGKINVKGPKGELGFQIRPEIDVVIKDNQITTSIKEETKESNAFWGLTRALIANMVLGVEKGFEKQLKLEGLGYRVKLEGDKLILQVGFSHPVIVEQPEGVIFSVKKNMITISGADKEKVSQSAATIRKIRKPEPYKGTGIMYIDEKIKRKLGKRATTEE